ncbi:ABC transporter substrate-binding protein [Crenothrix polyspora]|uniref:ABC transporter substrate-binding protein n=2 Tax=Crenothrix polyspora TaxID=360316 RepID=A0A1R4HE63_9GAMM|nr:ABC transporter substrate-binding protein [Crenothrix polyspora]
MTGSLKRMKRNIFLIGFGLLVSSYCLAAEKITLRIGVQATGTVVWELSAMQADPAFKNSDFQLDIHPVATAEAGKIALQSGAVDMIVSDWIWVSKLRHTGADFTFYPYSTASGGLVVPEKSAIQSIKDLPRKRLGIAGGELDKNWLFLQALAAKENIKLNDSVEKVFGAPPLVNEQLKQGRVDAVLTYWHFAVGLESEGYRQIIDGKAILQGLGIQEQMPMIGYVFKESWANDHKQAVSAFFKASKQARDGLCASDTVWQTVIPLLNADKVTTQTKLRQRYCEGTVIQWGEPEQQAAGRIYSLLRTLSSNQLTGDTENLSLGTFWSLK